MLNDRILFADEEQIETFSKQLQDANYYFVEQLIRKFAITKLCRPSWYAKLSKYNFQVLQFWDTSEIPHDVRSTIKHNAQFFGEGSHLLFNLEESKQFLDSEFSDRVLRAFENCRHPAMQSDFFRLAYLYAKGGLYIDADNKVLSGFGIDNLYRDDLIVSAAIRDADPNEDGSWNWHKLESVVENKIACPVCYFHNDALASGAESEIIRIALIRAVHQIESAATTNSKIRAHTATGPTNLTAAILIAFFRAALTNAPAARLTIFDRDECLTGGQYEYKKDARNWMVADA